MEREHQNGWESIKIKKLIEELKLKEDPEEIRTGFVAKKHW